MYLDGLIFIELYQKVTLYGWKKVKDHLQISYYGSTRCVDFVDLSMSATSRLKPFVFGRFRYFYIKMNTLWGYSHSEYFLTLILTAMEFKEPHFEKRK
jgi:hypothetical protein